MMQNKFIYVHSNLNQVVRILLHFTTLSFVPFEKKKTSMKFVSSLRSFIWKNDSLKMIWNWIDRKQTLYFVKNNFVRLSIRLQVAKIDKLELFYEYNTYLLCLMHLKFDYIIISIHYYPIKILVNVQYLQIM